MKTHGPFEMEMYSGKLVDPTLIRPEDIDIEDIGYHLASICRFGGACRINVADHSVRVAKIVELLGGCTSCQFEGLMHDSHEAYISDVITPLGRQEFMRPHSVLKISIQRIIDEVYPTPEHHEKCEPDSTWQKAADTLAGILEADACLPSGGKGWECYTTERAAFVKEYRDYFPELYSHRLPSSEESEIAFMELFEVLKKGPR